MSRLKLITVGQLARRSGVTVRTLHHYDAIGLLRPAGRAANGRRLYDRDNALRLQQIMLYRTLGLSLEEIARILDDPGFDRRAALIAQRAAVEAQITQSRALVRGIDEALALIDDKKEVDMATLFGGFDPSQFEDEAKARWGKTEAYREHARRTADYSAEDWKRYHAEHGALCARFAALAADGAPPDGAEAARAAKDYAALIDRWFYPCDASHLGPLAEMYAADTRFQETFNGFGEGTAAFIIKAFRACASG